MQVQQPPTSQISVHHTSNDDRSPISITMPPAFAVQHLDELVREFLLFRGFTVTYKVTALCIGLCRQRYVL